MPNQTLTFDESIKGWPSFHSFDPEVMIGMNNSFFTVRDGQLYRHNVDGARNTFYGVQYPSEIEFSVNQAASDIKVVNAVNTESTSPWFTTIRAFQGDQDRFSESTILESEYVDKEGKHFAYSRRNELPADRSAKNIYGLGRVTAINGNDVTLDVGGQLNTALTQGDDLYNGVTNTLLGTITAINLTDPSAPVLTVSSVVGLNVNDFVFGVKDSRIEGAQMRGYTFRITLQKTSDDFQELFAFNSEIMQSKP